ncbi:hypothetical protein NFD58_12590 [Staphylococcus epidermidis]|nr:hypothetical protein [Staphylococcus epidermidis]
MQKDGALGSQMMRLNSLSKTRISKNRLPISIDLNVIKNSDEYQQMANN